MPRNPGEIARLGEEKLDDLLKEFKNRRVTKSRKEELLLQIRETSESMGLSYDFRYNGGKLP